MSEFTFFCSPIGLGHATRDAAIGSFFDENAIKFVSGSGAAQFFAKCNFDVENAYTPPNFNVRNGLLQNPLKWLWKYYNYYKDCKKISAKIIAKENPKMVVSDEDFASLSIAQERKLPSILITDILETHFTKGFGGLIERKMNRSMQDIITKCDVVILPEEGDNIGNIRRVGPIVREIKSSRDELRKKFCFENKTLVVSIGGTDAGKFLIEKTLEATSKLDIDVVIVSGPSLDKDYGKNTKNLGFVENLHEIIFASDLVVSLAGKSTIDESKAYGTPGIFIPIKDHFEQEDNAKEEGFSYEDILRLESLITDKLNQKRNPINSDGAKKAYSIINQLLEQTKP